MTAPTEAKAPCPLAPSSVLAFSEALNGPKGSLDNWLECNNESEVRAHIEAYARAKVAELVAAARAMNVLAKGPTGGVSQQQKREVVARMDAALAAFSEVRS